MDAITRAIYRRLVDDNVLVGMVATYKQVPAIFTSEPIPADATLPCIVLSPPLSTVPNDTKTREGRVIQRDLRVYADGDQSVLDSGVDGIAEQVRVLLHRRPLTVDSWTNPVADVTGPGDAPTDDSLHGRLLTVSLTLRPQ